MVKHADSEKQTKIYIPKVPNPQILSYRSAEPEMTSGQFVTMASDNKNNNENVLK